ncbi:MAG: S9 family peptidase [Acidimicrobiales bacterium]
MVNGSIPKRPIRPSDLYRLRSVSDVAVHPDGRQVVFVVTWPDEQSDSNRSQLYRVDVDGSDHRRLTEGPSDTRPRFSPDGSRLAFLRSEPGKPGKLMILDWPVGDVHEVASFEDGGPGDPCWVDAHRVVTAAPQRPSGQVGVGAEELRRRPKIITSPSYRFNAVGYNHDRPQQLWMVDLSSPAPDPVAVGAAGLNHGAFAVSPDATAVVATAALGPDDMVNGTNHLIRYDLPAPGSDAAGSPEPTVLTARPGYWTQPVWHGDGRLLTLGFDRVDEIGFDRLFEVDPTHTGVPVQVAFDDVSMDAGRSQIRCVDGAVLVTGPRRGRVAIDRYDIDGARTVLYEDDSTVVAFDVAPNTGELFAAITTTQRPAELWKVAAGHATKLVALNDDVLAEVDIAATESVAVTSLDGTIVEAFVTRPPASAPSTGSQRPGLVYVHGGPMFQYGHYFFDEFQLAAAAGYVVIGGNPRGSDGYGESWARDIVGNFGNRDWQDVQAITRFLADQPDVDVERIGIGGGSYGGFMTCWALGHDTEGRYRAGLVERAVTDFESMAGTSDIGQDFIRRMLDATIEDDVEAIRRQSPLNWAHQIKAPTLILHSEEDWRCPIEQAERLYAAIWRNAGNAILVRFPGENHELSRSGSPKHRVERFEIVHEFFAAHLGGADFGTSHLNQA